MTPLEALATLRLDAARTRLRLAMDMRLRPDTVDGPVHLLVCEACGQALLAELDSAFAPLVEPHMRRLEGSHVMGCTFSAGPVETCALHHLVCEMPQNGTAVARG
jgi:hypothetical protein